MSKLLHIDSSGSGNMSTTKSLTKYFAEKWQSANKNGEVISRDLQTSKLTFITEEAIVASRTPADQHTASQKQILALSEELIKELIEADTYVFGVPMYNFSVPGIFKSYIDQVVRPGRTFSYEGGRPEGLLKGKRLIVVTASGADYSDAPMKGMDFLEPYLRTIFGFLGVNNIEFVAVRGREPEVIAAGCEVAKKQIDLLLTTNVMASH